MSSGRPKFAYLKNDFPLAIAHRGGAKENPENSAQAFNHAYELGFRYIETDVHLSRDGEVVVFHDRDLVRLGKRSVRISALDWAQIKRIRLRSGASIPRLKSLLKSMPAANFNIDMKSDQVVAPLLELIQKLGCQERVCLASFYDHRLSRARQYMGTNLCTSAGRFSVITQILRARGLPLLPSQAPVLQVPWRKAGIEIVTPGFVNRAHQDGKDVHVWTVDDPDLINHLLDIGVDGIMTDQPQVLKQVFLARGLWRA